MESKIAATPEALDSVMIEIVEQNDKTLTLFNEGCQHRYTVNRSKVGKMNWFICPHKKHARSDTWKNSRGFHVQEKGHKAP